MGHFETAIRKARLARRDAEDSAIISLAESIEAIANGLKEHLDAQQQLTEDLC